MSNKTKVKAPVQRLVQLNLPQELKSWVEQLSERSGLSQADIARLAIERGQGALEEMFPDHEKQAA